MRLITQNLKFKLLLAFLGVGLVPLAVYFFISNSSTNDGISSTITNQLTSVREIKKTQIENYFNTIRKQVVTFSKDVMIVEAMNAFKESFHNYQYEPENIDKDFNKAQSNVAGYYNNEFLPRLEQKSGQSFSSQKFLPDEINTILLQNDFIAANPNATGEKDNLNQLSNNTNYSNFHLRYHPAIREYLKQFGYYDIFLIDHNTGHIVYSVFKEVDYGTSLFTGPYSNTNFAEVVKKAANASEEQFSKIIDFKTYKPSYGAPASFIASPIFDGNTKIGVLAFQMPVDEINSIMTSNQQWESSGFGKSGESYLVGSDGLMRSDSRFLVEDKTGYLNVLKNAGFNNKTIQDIEQYETSIILQPVETISVRDANSGKTGTRLVEDYRGISVVSSYSPIDIEDINWSILVEMDEEEAYMLLGSLRNSAILTMIICSAIIAVFGIFFALRIARPVVKLKELSNQVAEGNYDVQVNINLKDEIGQLAKNFGIMVKSIKKSVEEINMKTEETEQALKKATELKRNAEEQQQYLSRNTRVILAEMEKFSEGDLTVNLVPEKQDDDIAALFDGFNKTVRNIKNMILQVGEAVEATASASTQISSSSEEMAAGAQEQSTQASEVASSVDEMTKTILESAKNASLASKSSQDASAQARDGACKVEESKKGMDDIVRSADNTGSIIASLASKTDQIGEIAQVIDDIADQTNLLALNAAIEAARAGEQGRGFAVVADEVRKLAERTTKATKEIAETIRAIQSEAKDADASMKEAKGSVQNGINLTNEVNEVLQNILKSSDHVEHQINQLATASEEQSTAAEQISRSIDGISSVTHESAAGTQQIARTAEDLNKLTVNLQKLISSFKIDDKTSNYSVRSNGVLIEK